MRACEKQADRKNLAQVAHLAARCEECDDVCANLARSWPLQKAGRPESGNSLAARDLGLTEQEVRRAKTIAAPSRETKQRRARRRARRQPVRAPEGREGCTRPRRRSRSFAASRNEVASPTTSRRHPRRMTIGMIRRMRRRLPPGPSSGKSRGSQAIARSRKHQRRRARPLDQDHNAERSAARHPRLGDRRFDPAGRTRREKCSVTDEGDLGQRESLVRRRLPRGSSYASVS